MTRNPFLVQLRDFLGIRRLLIRIAAVGLAGLLSLTAGEYRQMFGVQLAGYADNADVKVKFGTATAFTITNANLANSPTAGWVSNAIDNTTNLYLDALVHVALAAVNTAPANAKGTFLYGYGLVDSSGSVYTSSGGATPAGTEGTLTYPDYTTLPVVMPLVGFIPYPTQNVASNGGPFSVAKAFGGILPPKWGLGMVNHTGMTLSVTSIKYLEVYNTVI